MSTITANLLRVGSDILFKWFSISGDPEVLFLSSIDNHKAEQVTLHLKFMRSIPIDLEQLLHLFCAYDQGGSGPF